MAATTEAEIKEQFWKSLNASPFVMLELDNAPHTAAPMTAQLDQDAHGAIWFFTARDSLLARMGPATATFAAKDHELFARFSGRLTEEKSGSVLERHWCNAVEAWFPEGRDSAQVLLMRMELGEASIWSAKLGALAVTKMLLGMNVREDAKGHHTHTSL